MSIHRQRCRILRIRVRDYDVIPVASRRSTCSPDLTTSRCPYRGSDINRQVNSGMDFFCPIYWVNPKAWVAIYSLVVADNVGVDSWFCCARCHRMYLLFESIGWATFPKVGIAD